MLGFKAVLILPLVPSLVSYHRAHLGWVGLETARPGAPSLCCSTPPSSSFVISRRSRPRPGRRDRQRRRRASATTFRPWHSRANPCSPPSSALPPRGDT